MFVVLANVEVWPGAENEPRNNCLALLVFASLLWSLEVRALRAMTPCSRRTRSHLLMHHRTLPLVGLGRAVCPSLVLVLAARPTILAPDAKCLRPVLFGVGPVGWELLRPLRCSQGHVYGV